MNELEIKASWLKIQVNSYYGLSQSTNNKLLDDYVEIKSKIRVIKLRTSKIKRIWKTDGIV
jgi:hypothetical protein